MRSWPEPPAWLVWLGAVLALVGTGVMFVGAVRIGVTVDETFHVVRLRNYFEHGWYLLDDDLSGGSPGSWVLDAYVYGPVTTLFLHVLNVVVGNEAWGTLSATADAYLVRHLGIALIGLVGAVATAGMARLATGSWRWAVIAAGTLMCLPMWPGHSMFNVKDVPVGTGYTLVSLGAMIWVGTQAPQHARRLLAGASIVLGLFLAVGTRPAMWPMVCAGLGVAALFAVVRGSRVPGGRSWWVVVDAAVIAVLTLVLLAVIYPSGFGNAWRWLVSSVLDSGANGMVTSRSHLPRAVATTVPVLLLLFLFLGGYGRLRSWLAHRVVDVQSVRMMVLVLQAFLLPTLLVIKSSAASGGLRHVLFAAPPVAILICSGIAQLLSDTEGSRRTRNVVAGLAGAGLVIPAVAQVQAFPYSYAHVNEFVALADIPYTSDFWQASAREVAPELPDGTFVVCGADRDEEGRPLRRMPNGGQSWLALGDDCGRSPLGVMTPYVSSPADPLKVDERFAALLIQDPTTAPGCRMLTTAERRHLADEVVMGALWDCPVLLTDYVGAVTLDGGGAGYEFLLGGWRAPGGADAVTTTDVGSLGFRVRPARPGVSIEVTGESAGEVDFLVNNVPADSSPAGNGWVVSLEDVPAWGRPGDFVLTVRAVGGPVSIRGVEVTDGVGQ